MKPALFAAAACLSAALGCGSAAATFTACNKTEYPIGIAIAHSTGIEWISEGWWTIGPRACADILQGPLMARYYYVHAIHEEAGGGWMGDRYFCIASRSFTISGRDECEPRGYRRAGFYEIDTGNAQDWREELYVDGPEPATPDGQ